MLSRIISERIAKRKKSTLLLGPRQVGKSTLLRALAPTRTINLADEVQYLGFAKDPGRLRREVGMLRPGHTVVIDEVQRLPTLLNTVQAIIDEGAAPRFLLTGSSARRLRQRGVNLLPGRVVLEHLDSLLYWELGAAFDLERALRLGGLPGVYLDSEGGEEILDTYATVYLREEVQAEAAVRDIGGYARFLDAAAEASGAWVTYSKWASELEINKETIRRYTTLLHDTLLTHTLPAYKPRPSARHVSQRDRFLFFDLGVRNALLGVHGRQPTQTEYGALFEQWLILQCIGFVRAHRQPWRWFAYRTDAGAEVAFILDLGDRLVALKIKWSKVVTSRASAGLRSFARVADKPVAAYVVCRCDHPQKLADHIYAVPYRHFLQEILPGFIP